MALTRQVTEYVVSEQRRIDAFLLDLGIDSGCPPDAFTEPIYWSLVKLGYTPAERLAVTNAEIANVTTAQEESFLDLVEYRILDNVWKMTASAAMAASVGPESVTYGDRMERLERILSGKRAMILAEHDIELTEPGALKRARIMAYGL